MTRTGTLADIVERLDTLDDEATLYASEPWSPESDALVAREPEHGLPDEARRAGLTYFLEVAIAREVAQGLAGNLDERRGSALCQHLIHYAIHDA